MEDFNGLMSMQKKSHIDDYLEQRVEERLLKKGQEYKNNINHKRHEVI